MCQEFAYYSKVQTHNIVSSKKGWLTAGVYCNGSRRRYLTLGGLMPHEGEVMVAKPFLVKGVPAQVALKTGKCGFNILINIKISIYFRSKWLLCL